MFERFKFALCFIIFFMGCNIATTSSLEDSDANTIITTPSSIISVQSSPDSSNLATADNFNVESESPTASNPESDSQGLFDSSIQVIQLPEESIFKVAEGDGLVELISWYEDKLIFVQSQAYFAFDPLNQQTITLDALPPINFLPKPLMPLPEYYEAFPSQSQEKALFIDMSDAPIKPTINPNVEGGEPSYFKVNLNYKLWQDEQIFNFQETVLACNLGKPVWSPNEEFIFLVETSYPFSGCEDSPYLGWLFETNNKTVTPLFDPHQYPLFRSYTFSPNNRRFAFGYGFFDSPVRGTLGILDIESGSIIYYNSVVNVLGWLSDHELLVNYIVDPHTPASYSIGILDIQTQVFNDLTSSISSKRITNSGVLSPDGTWHAFFVGENWFNYEELWLIKVK